MPISLSTADIRRRTVIESAIAVFAETGYLGTPITAIAQHAKISPAYVFKLYSSKETLFVAALQRDFELIQESLALGASASADQTPAGVLSAMGLAYAFLIKERALLMLQVHALSAADVPEIRNALHSGLAQITAFVKARSGADNDAVQRFFAYGQLCHMIVTLGLNSEKSKWARTLTAGLRHP